MHNGLKNLFASRSAAQHERLKQSHSHGNDDDSGVGSSSIGSYANDDDSGIGGATLSDDEDLYSAMTPSSSFYQYLARAESFAGSHGSKHPMSKDRSAIAQGYNQTTYSEDYTGLFDATARKSVSETNNKRPWARLNAVDNKAELSKTDSYSQDKDSSNIYDIEDTIKDVSGKNELSLSSEQRIQLPAEIPGQRFLDSIVNDTAGNSSGRSDAAISKEDDDRNQVKQSLPFAHDLQDNIRERTEQYSRRTPTGAQRSHHSIIIAKPVVSGK
ncbi:hypothetical protein F4777DRAFT_286868 [Nemania sp. FL0916]|nr:hypothetical protein F4777DRAFT_286868 [Nemania sp. FL0916]